MANDLIAQRCKNLRHDLKETGLPDVIYMQIVTEFVTNLIITRVEKGSATETDTRLFENMEKTVGKIKRLKGAAGGDIDSMISFLQEMKDESSKKDEPR